MKRALGRIFIVIGLMLISASVVLFAHNRIVEIGAEEASAALLPQIYAQIEENLESEEESTEPEQPLGTPVEYLSPETLEMTETVIDGHAYIGYLTIPALDLNLPVMSNWSYTKLRIAPCRYAGTVRGEDLVIMAHNYNRHFGRLSTLIEGDQVAFTDMDGAVAVYEVAAMDILEPYAVEEMTSGEFDLTLFTCTYGGNSRVTIYCNRIKN